MLALAIAAQLAQPITSDVSWLLYVARRVLAGAALGRDVVELTPPLIIWLEEPVVALAHATGLSLHVAQTIAVTLLVLASSAATTALVRRYTDVRLGAGPLMLLLVALLGLLPGVDFGQREHMALLLALPYVALLAARMQGARVPLALAVVIGIAAGAGLSIKPQHGVIWAVVLIVAAVHARSFRVLLRPEHLAIAGTGAALIAAYAITVPAYWPALRVLGVSYGPYLHLGLLQTAFLSDGSRLPLFALLAYAALRSSGPRPPLQRALVLGVIVTFAAAVAQQKGWRYHFLPALTLAAMLLVSLAASGVALRRRLAPRLYHAAVIATLGWLGARTAGDALDRAVHPGDERFAPFPGYAALVSQLRHDGVRRLLVLSSNLGTDFPLAEASGAEWASRYPSLWVLAGVHEPELRVGVIPVPPAPDEQTPAERRLLDTVAEDLERERPDVVLELRPQRSDAPWGGAMLLPYVSYLRRATPRLDSALAAYRYAGVAGVFRVYRREPVPPAGVSAPVGGSGLAVPARVSAPSGAAVMRLRGHGIADGLGLMVPIFLFALWLERRRYGASGAAGGAVTPSFRG